MKRELIKQIYADQEAFAGKEIVLGGLAQIPYTSRLYAGGL